MARLNEFYSKRESEDYELFISLMDAFYSNPDNTHIPVMDALHIIMLHESGERTRANELLLRKQRIRSVSYTHSEPTRPLYISYAVFCLKKKKKKKKKQKQNICLLNLS